MPERSDKTRAGTKMLVLCTVVLGLTLISSASADYCWDFFVYAQIWPETACMDVEAGHHHKCSLAANISTWTVHGLWPTKTGTYGPAYCNKTDKFDLNKVKPLYSTLLKYWPNTQTDEAIDSFWEHEWDKHGTCTKGVPNLEGEYNYFSTGFRLNRRFDLLMLFEKEGIIPDAKKRYDHNVLINSMEKAVGTTLEILCFYNKTEHIQYIQQMEMCLSKDLTPIVCPKRNADQLKFEPLNSIEDPLYGYCMPDVQIIYPPIRHPY